MISSDQSPLRATARSTTRRPSAAPVHCVSKLLQGLSTQCSIDVEIARANHDPKFSSGEKIIYESDLHAGVRSSL
jgi:hypothetical protein